MNKVGVVIILILVISMLFACNAHNHNMLYDLVACGSFAVPGMMCADLKGDSYSCTVMETDQQGRIMFSYTTVSVCADFSFYLGAFLVLLGVVYLIWYLANLSLRGIAGIGMIILGLAAVVYSLLEGKELLDRLERQLLS